MSARHAIFPANRHALYDVHRYSAAIRSGAPKHTIIATGGRWSAIDELLQKTGAQLWIQHDILTNATLKKSPRYYD